MTLAALFGLAFLAVTGASAAARHRRQATLVDVLAERIPAGGGDLRDMLAIDVAVADGAAEVERLDVAIRQANAG